MGKRKIKPLFPWETASESREEKRYSRTSYTLLTHPAYIRLTNLEKHVYNCMRMAFAGKPEFTFPQACYEREYGLSKTSVQKAVKGLQAAGFIQVTRRWQVRQPNIYRFTNDWKTRLEPP